MPIAIPKMHVEPLRRLATVEESVFRSLVDVLSIGSSFVPPGELADRARSVMGDEQIDATLLTDMLISMVHARSVHPQSSTEFANLVAEGMQAELGIEEREGLRSRVEELTSLPSIETCAKAMGLASDHERTFHSARILTDLRPVFSGDASSQPVGTVTFHTLKLDTFSSAGAGDFFVAMDDEDLQELKFAVDRAVEKAASLRLYLQSLGFAQFDTEPRS